MNRAFLAALALQGVLLSLPALAHHGKDFLSVESYEIPHPGDVYLAANAEWGREDEGDTTGLEPSVLVGIAPRVAGEIHGHFVREPGSDSFEYEAIAPAVHAQLTDHHASVPVHVGLSAEYEFGADAVEDAFEARLIFEKDFGGTKATANFIGEHVAGESTEYGYAAGVRLDFSDAVAAGLEARGSFEATAGEALAAIYCEPDDRLTFKVGIGTGFGEGPDMTAHLGGVFRF